MWSRCWTTSVSSVPMCTAPRWAVASPNGSLCVIRTGSARSCSAAPPQPFTTLGDPLMPAYAKGRHLTAGRQHDSWEVLLAIKAATLVIHGTDDVFNPAANAPLLADRIAGARLQLIPGARPPTSRISAAPRVRWCWTFSLNVRLDLYK